MFKQQSIFLTFLRLKNDEKYLFLKLISPFVNSFFKRKWAKLKLGVSTDRVRLKTLY